MSINRRNFIKGMAGAGVVASLNQLGMMQAAAALTEDYRALVCVFLFGGNDGNNTIVPIDAAGTPITPRYAAASPFPRPPSFPLLHQRAVRLSASIPASRHCKPFGMPVR